MRTLIISRPDRVGDVVISTSCLAPIREKYPDAKIYFVAADNLLPLLAGHPLLAGCFPLSADLEAEFRRINATALVHLHPHPKCYAAGKSAGVPVRIGYPGKLFGGELTHEVVDQRTQGMQHEARYNFELVKLLGVPTPEKFSANIHLPEKSRDALQAKLPWPLTTTRYAVLCPGASVKSARWALENFVRVAERLKAEFNLLPVFAGAEADEIIFPEAAGFLNLAGRTDLAELGWLLKHAQVAVANASGPSHLAAAVDCPVITLFGRITPIYGPRRWHPLSDKAIVVTKQLPQKLFEKREDFWRRSFAAISVDEVMAAISSALPAEKK
jgi:ADP-heptose:LPS heptosyltransferase